MGSYTRNEYNSANQDSKSYEDVKIQMANSWAQDIAEVKSVDNIAEGQMWKLIFEWWGFVSHIKLWISTFEPKQYLSADWLKNSSVKYDLNATFSGDFSLGKDRKNSSTARFERSMQTQIDKIKEHLKDSNYKSMIKELNKLAKMLKYSKNYIGKHRPLYKYDQVRQAFSGLSDKITNSTRLIQEKIEKISTTYPVE